MTQVPETPPVDAGATARSGSEFNKGEDFDMEKFLDPSYVGEGVFDTDEKGRLVPAQGAPEEVPAETPETPAGTPAVPEGQAPAVQEIPEGEGVEFAGRRFATLEDAQRSYLSMQTLQTQTTTAYEALQGELGRYYQALQQVQPLMEELQQLRQGAQAPAAPASPQVDLSRLDPSDPQYGTQLQAYIAQEADRLAQVRVAGVVGPLQQQVAQMGQSQQQQAAAQWQSQVQMMAEQASGEFQRRHPEVQPGSPIDVDMGNIANLHQLNPASIDDIELAYDIWQNPALGDVLIANPMFRASPQGRQLARSWAQTYAAAPRTGATPPQGAPTGRVTPAGTAGSAGPRPIPHVESGNTGVPLQGAPGERPDEEDSLVQILQLAAEDRGKGKSLFFRS